MKMNKIELSIVMPCLNEAETLEICIKKAFSFINNENIIGEVVIADNGSTDGSQEIAIKNGARLITVSKKGYGYALSEGIKNSFGKYIIIGDSDDSYDFSNLSLFLLSLKNGADLVMGNRFQGGIKKKAMPFLHRYLGNPVLSFIGRLFFKIKVKDFHCGLRGFTNNAFQKMNLKTTGMEFASEMVVKAALYKMNITEVPTVLHPDGRSRPPHLRTWRDGWRHLRFLLMFAPDWLFLYPSLFIILSSFITGLLLIYKPLEIKGITFDIHSLICLSFMLIIGFQFLFFHFFVKIHNVIIGLVPEPKNFKKIFKYFNLEKGILIGLFLFIYGLIIMVLNINTWSLVSFKDLDPISFTRKTIQGIVPLSMGIQITMNSFIFSILGLSRKK